MDAATVALLGATLDEAVPDAAVLLDAGGGVRHANRLALALFGVGDVAGIAAAIPAERFAAACARAAVDGAAVLAVDGVGPARLRALRGLYGTTAGWLLLLGLRALATADNPAAQEGDCPWVWDIQHGHEVYSRAWLSMLGLQAGESPRIWRERVHPDDLDGALAALAAACAPDAPPYVDEYRMRHADGRWLWVRSQARVVARDAAGRALRMVGVDRDASDAHATALTLDSREALLAMAERLAGVGYWAWDPLSDRVQWSAGLYRTFGLPADAPPPRLAQTPELLEPDSYERLQSAVRRALEHGDPYSVQIEIRRADGRTGVAIAMGEAVRDAGGRVVRLWGVTCDVTAQRESLRGQQRQAALLARMSRIAAIGGWSYDVASQRLEWTEETYRLHDVEPGIVIDPAYAIDFYLPPWREQVARAFRLALEQATPFDIESRLRTARGREIWVRAIGEAEVVDGRTRLVFGTFQDISDAKESRIRLAQALDDLRARNRDLQDFTTAASHDLQEPLRKVQALGSLLLERHGGGLAADGVDLLDRMRGAAARMADLVDDLLAYSRIGRGAMSTVEADLAQVAAGVVADLEHEIRRAGAVVEIAPLPRIHADPTQMRQLLQNLIGNALKYRDGVRAPQVRVSARRIDLAPPDGGESRPGWRLQVADNGIGFEPRFAEQIFAPFQRLHDRSRYEGTGMGLAIVRRIVERHGGRVHAEGRPGEGAVFTVDLPVDGAAGDGGGG